MQGRVPQVAPLVDDLLHGRGQPLVRRVQQEIQAALEPVGIICEKTLLDKISLVGCFCVKLVIN